MSALPLMAPFGTDRLSNDLVATEGGFVIYERNCAECGNGFTTKSPVTRFCSHKCYGKVRSRTYRGMAHPNFKGLVRRGHYLARFVPHHPLASRDGYVLEHRRVVYDAGIDVPEGYHVHHKNHDKTDNRLENLIVINASEHHRHHIEDAGKVVNQFGTWPLRRNR